MLKWLRNRKLRKFLKKVEKVQGVKLRNKDEYLSCKDDDLCIHIGGRTKYAYRYSDDIECIEEITQILVDFKKVTPCDFNLPSER